jgi:hypothetical protein
MTLLEQNLRNLSHDNRISNDQRVCLKCRHLFCSRGPGNRLCVACEMENRLLGTRYCHLSAGIDLEVRGSVEYTDKN